MPDPKAFQLYLIGRYHWNKRTPEGLRKAIEYFKQAIAADPGWSRAYAGLADTFCLLPGYGVAPPFDAMPKARAAAAKALEIDEILAEAHASLGYVKASYEWKWDEAEREYRRAMELSPGYATAHHWYAGFLRAAGRLEQAKAEIERAQALDPLSPVIGTDAGTIFRAMRRHDEAIRQYRKVIAFEPNFHTAHLNLGIDYAAKGLYSQAIETFEHVRRLSGAMPNNVAWLGYCYARSGRKDKARDALAELDALARQGYVAPSLVALVYIGFGDKERAFEWLEKGCGQRDSLLSGSLAVEPVFDPLRRDPRFRSLLQRIGLPVR
jgi:serine/threonine-protein kinase